jgi:hypothetical protein
MAMLTRILDRARAWMPRLADPPAAELWCRPATVLALRDREQAPACISGWH